MDAPTVEPEGEDEPEPEPEGRLDMMALAKVTIPLHIILPWALYALALIDPAIPAWVFLGIHAGFPVLALVTYPLWRGQGVDLIILLMLNHLATFLSAGAGALFGGFF